MYKRQSISFYAAGTLFVLIFSVPILDFVTQYVFKAYTPGSYYTPVSYTHLNGMGFGGRDKDTVCGTLSGGEKTRLALAKLLLDEPDVLMLDEPTNHLDFITLQWLEEYLQAWRGALIVVSHDRYFLDKVCTRIWDVANLRLTAYRGNYTKYMHTLSLIHI